MVVPCLTAKVAILYAIRSPLVCFQACASIKRLWLYLDGTEGVVLAGADALGDGGETACNALERQQEGRLILGQHVAQHVTMTGRQQVHLLHRVDFELVESRLRPLDLRLHLTHVTDSHVYITEDATNVMHSSVQG